MYKFNLTSNGSIQINTYEDVHQHSFVTRISYDKMCDLCVSYITIQADITSNFETGIKYMQAVKKDQCGT